MACTDDDIQLVARAQAGDALAFTALVDRYSTRIYRLAMGITGNPEDGEDVLQDVFLRAYSHLASFRGDASFSTWITKIAINCSIATLRKRRGLVSLDEPIRTDSDESLVRDVADWGESPEQRYSREELGGIVTRAIRGLSPGLRMVFLLRDIEGFSVKETAAMLDLNVPLVKSRLLRARLRLRERLDRHFRLPDGARLPLGEFLPRASFPQIAG